MFKKFFILFLTSLFFFSFHEVASAQKDRTLSQEKQSNSLTPERVVQFMKSYLNMEEMLLDLAQRHPEMRFSQDLQYWKSQGANLKEFYPRDLLVQKNRVFVGRLDYPIEFTDNMSSIIYRNVKMNYRKEESARELDQRMKNLWGKFPELQFARRKTVKSWFSLLSVEARADEGEGSGFFARIFSNVMNRILFGQSVLQSRVPDYFNHTNYQNWENLRMQCRLAGNNQPGNQFIFRAQIPLRGDTAVTQQVLSSLQAGGNSEEIRRILLRVCDLGSQSNNVDLSDVLKRIRSGSLRSRREFLEAIATKAGTTYDAVSEIPAGPRLDRVAPPTR